MTVSGAMKRIGHVDVRDIARVAARAPTATGPEALSYGDEAATRSRVLGKPVSYVTLTDDAGRAGMLAAGMPGL